MDNLKAAYRRQQRAALHRNIEWNFTFETWVSWWELTEKLHLRGKTKERPYQMCRFGDDGPYSPDNVYCGTMSDNVRDVVVAGRHRGWVIGHERRREISSMGGKASTRKLPDLVVSERLQLISDIDLAKWGWVAKVASVLGVSHTHARRFVDANYIGAVYKRN